MPELVVNRVLPPDCWAALRDAITVSIGANKCGGVVRRKDVYSLIFEAGVSADDMNTALQLALSFDTSTRTAGQIQDVAEKTDIQSLLNLADNAITTINNELNAITADGTALAAASSLAAVKPIVQNMLDRQATMDTRQRAIIKAIKRIRLLG